MTVPALSPRERLIFARELASWPLLEAETGRLDLHRYQLITLMRAVHRLQGRAILADEVGLGKTVETGLILQELRARGLVRYALILVPAGLKSQWQAELAARFGWTAGEDARQPGWLWVLSLAAAKRSPLREQLAAVPWDLVAVDEAHQLKNPRTFNHALVRTLTARYLLLITATPLENRLEELYALVDLVRPGLFGSYLAFYRRFILAPRTPRTREELRTLLDQVLVRHRREETGLALPPREVVLWPIRPDPAETALYHRLEALVRAEYRRRRDSRGTVLPLLTLERELCSSPAALAPTLRASSWLGPQGGELAAAAAALEETAKARATLEVIRHADGQVLVFTGFRGTQEWLVRFLTARGVEAAAFHGGLSAAERDRLLAWFRQGGRVLVSTEAGGQGLNLQFCHHLVNFDLPWNPMRIEQRIGRVHRVGQVHPVQIYNLFAAGTLEEDILYLLHDKIDLFRQVIGELDVILRHLERRGSLESRLLDILAGEEDRAEVRRRLDALAREFAAARRRIEGLTAPASGAAGPGQESPGPLH
ncbi:Uncharacterized ATP-dependent helicase YqhH [Candidatus Hydrogenisulfobacillus filiaventi]|uniref:Uncharacterized ATP-dependent helicase YqhH n=1 Tax=Candidatus Hydrogenisulfobacillus filiaventi TaxID=2707344 RepID=A0A6F8ZFJ5_9FIRM|nr:Uncharacterized ATP-dependent helicase YqhH [Candidatus Hydrogenisulfobacillus filiaventi]